MSADKTTPPVPYKTSGEEWDLAEFKLDEREPHGYAIISGEQDPVPWGLFDDRALADAVCAMIAATWDGDWGIPRVYYARNTSQGIEYWNGPAVEDIDELVKNSEVKS